MTRERPRTHSQTKHDFAALRHTLDERRGWVEQALAAWCPQGNSPEIEAAVRGSLFAPAKRIRPILALLVAEIFRGSPQAALPAACSIEMVHTASLILDDLPSMDNASLRRGRPACHIAHGEAVAILAAFALINRAFEILALGWRGGPSAAVRLEITRELTSAIGLDGMIAGQARDLTMTEQQIDFGTLEFIHSRKTGALFIASAALGAAIANAAPAKRRAVGLYAKNLGLAFQIVDDWIDVVGVTDKAGKDVRKDLKKTTFVSFSGIDGAWQLATELVTASQDALVDFGVRAQPLRELASYVVSHRR